MYGQQPETVITPLTTRSSVAKRIAALQVNIPLATLRRGPYGWDFSGKWEVELQFLPWLSNQLNEVNIYTPGRNNGEPGLSTSFGPDRFYDLALLRTEAVSISKRPGISLINVAIARQLPGGFRFGLGLLVYRNLSPRRLSQEEVTNLANAGEVIYSRRLSYGESFLYGQVSYTFRPQRRLRPSVGLFIASIRGDYSGTGIITLIDGGTGEVIDRSDGRSLQWIASDRVFALAKIGLQYQLIRSFSIGFDAALLLGEDSYFEVPFISFGARYGFTGKG